MLVLLLLVLPYDAIALVDVVAAGPVIATLVVTVVCSASVVDATPVADLATSGGSLCYCC